MTVAPSTGKELHAIAHSLTDTVAMLNAMAHPCRLRMLMWLAQGQVCDVMTLTHLCGKPQPYVSQQLRILRNVGLVIGIHEGSRVCYRVASQRIKAVLQAAGVWEDESTTPGLAHQGLPDPSADQG